MSTSVTSTSISVTWSAPADLGGRSDLYYKVEISDPDKLGVYNTTYWGNESKSVKFEDLRPCTEYCVRVTAENGVSDQDPDGAEGRRETRCIQTQQGSERQTLPM